MKLSCVAERGFCRVGVLHAETVKDFPSVGRLGKMDGAGGSRAVDVHAEEALDGSEVVDSICLRELVVDFVDAGFGVGENEEVVDVYCDNGEVVVIVLSNKY